MIPPCFCLLAITVVITLFVYTFYLEPSMPSIRITEPFDYGYHSSWGSNVADGAVWGLDNSPEGAADPVHWATYRSGGPLIDELDPEQFL
jgi:hypothetical protein